MVKYKELLEDSWKYLKFSFLVVEFRWNIIKLCDILDYINFNLFCFFYKKL